MNIAAYCRVSTDKSDQLNSLETQKRFFTEYTKKSGHCLVRLYADEGISGTKIKNRKEFLRLLEDAKQGLFDMVVVKDISRFARNTVDLLQSIRYLKSLGIETTFLTANMTVLGQSEFVLTIFAALAQEESANTSKRVKFGKRMNAQKGRVPNLVYGYDKKAGDYFHLEINHKEAETVRRIFDWYIQDGYGALKIAHMLNEEGLLTKRGCAWSQNAVCRILTNELYAGKVINGKQEVTDFLTGTRERKDPQEWLVTHQPKLAIVSEEQLQKASSIMKERGKCFQVGKKRQSNKYLFSTLIRCGECGWSFRRTVRTYKNTYVRWVCAGRNTGCLPCCDNKTSVEEGELIATLEDYFWTILEDKHEIMKQKIKEVQRYLKKDSKNEEDKKAMEKSLARLTKARQKYVDLYAEDIISREELTKKTQAIRKEAENIKRKIDLLDCHHLKEEELNECIRRFVFDKKRFCTLKNMQNAQLRQIIEKIEVDREQNVDIYLCRFPV